MPSATTAPVPVVDAGIPAGNILFCGIEGDVVRLRKDLRDTAGHWIYWAFRVRGAAGRTLAFDFLDPLGADKPDRGAVGTRGAAVSTDRGASWAWTDDFRDDPRDSVTGDHESFSRFTWCFAPDADEVWFSQTIPYGPREWEDFLVRHEADRGRFFETGTLCRSRKGRTVETARFGRLDGQAPHKMLITSRHHCGEATATFVMEGILEAALADDDLGRWFRDTVEIRTVPFVDRDGVADGDQGKNRHPHDHNRDYNETPIYPEIRAIRAMAAEWTAGGAPPVVLDLHSPWLRGSWLLKDNANEYAYLVGKPETEAAQRRFCAILARIQRGGLGFQSSDYYAFGRGWNAGVNYAAGRSFARWAIAEWPDSPLVTTMEIPFANVRRTTLRPPLLRAFGRDIAAAIRELLQNTFCHT